MTILKDFDYCLSQATYDCGDLCFKNENIDGWDFEEVSETVKDKRRWVNEVETVYKHLPSGRFLALYHEVPNCEVSVDSVNHDIFSIYEVFEEEQVVKVFVKN